MKAILSSTAALAIGALVGCHNEPPSSPPPPTTAPVTVTPTAVNTSTATPPVVVKTAMLPDKDMTHTLTADSPYFTSKPPKDAKPDGTFKAGTKVLVMIPGAPMSKVTAQDGVVAYTSTDNLQPLGK